VPARLTLDQRQRVLRHMLEGGSISSLSLGRASQVWMPDSSGPPARWPAGERSE
jgi:hypothetical protein